MTKNMKYFKKCPGCGLEKEIKEEQTYCKECFRALHYGEIENNLTPIKQANILKEVKKAKGEVFLVTDVLTFKTNLVKKINNYVSPYRLTIIINKIDVLPKSINMNRLYRWTKNILKESGIEAKELIFLSGLKNQGIDYLNERFLNNNSNLHFIGYSNVGKSTIIKALAKVNNIEAKNITSYTLGTTLGKISLTSQTQELIDYPGFINNSNFLNFLTKKEIKNFIIDKEIKAKNYINLENKIINIENRWFLNIKTNDKVPFQIWVNNLLKVERNNYTKFLEKLDNREDKLIRSDITFDAETFANKKMLVIVGLGIIFLPEEFLQITLFLPENIEWYIEESFFQK